MDKNLCYSGNEIRTALLLAAKEYPAAQPALLKVAFHLGLDVHDRGNAISGWNNGTKAPPPGGWQFNVPMVEQ